MALMSHIRGKREGRESEREKYSRLLYKTNTDAKTCSFAMVEIYIAREHASQANIKLLNRC